MLIGGFQRNTVVDFPKLVASTIFLAGCNFRCPYCHNPELALGQCEPLSLEEILEYLSRARKKIIDGVCITGGEPTLDPSGLKELIAKLKALDLKIKLDTNGSNPELLKELELDYVALDLKTSFERYNEFSLAPSMPEKVKASFDYLLTQKKFPFEFRTTLYPPLVGKEEIKKLGALIADKAPWYLQRFSPKHCLLSEARNTEAWSYEEEEELLFLAKKLSPFVALRA